MYDDRELERQGRIPNHQRLVHVLGSDGLGYLFFKLELSDKGVYKLADIVEFVGIMRRLYLSYWEEARQYWETARQDGFHDACTFDEKTLVSLIEEYERGQPSG
jgi:hypothetical protein